MKSVFNHLPTIINTNNLKQVADNYNNAIIGDTY